MYNLGPVKTPGIEDRRRGDRAPLRTVEQINRSVIVDEKRSVGMPRTCRAGCCVSAVVAFVNMPAGQIAGEASRTYRRVPTSSGCHIAGEQPSHGLGCTGGGVHLWIAGVNSEVNVIATAGTACQTG